LIATPVQRQLHHHRSGKSKGAHIRVNSARDLNNSMRRAHRLQGSEVSLCYCQLVHPFPHCLNHRLVPLTIIVLCSISLFWNMVPSCSREPPRAPCSSQTIPILVDGHAPLDLLDFCDGCLLSPHGRKKSPGTCGHFSDSSLWWECCGCIVAVTIAFSLVVRLTIVGW
jgi:hypothetical protein